MIYINWRHLGQAPKQQRGLVPINLQPKFKDEGRVCASCILQAHGCSLLSPVPSPEYLFGK